VNADRGDIEFATGGALIQGLDVLQDVLKVKAVRGNEFLGEAIKHKGVVGIRRVTERQSRFLHRRKLNEEARRVTTRRTKQ